MGAGLCAKERVALRRRAIQARERSETRADGSSPRDVADLDLVLEEVLLVEEEHDVRVLKVLVLADGLEEVERLDHPVLGVAVLEGVQSDDAPD